MCRPLQRTSDLTFLHSHRPANVILATQQTILYLRQADTAAHLTLIIIEYQKAEVNIIMRLNFII